MTDTDHGGQPLTKNAGNSQQKVSHFVEVIVPLAKLANLGNIGINPLTPNDL
jgi:hypothetical protein